MRDGGGLDLNTKGKKKDVGQKKRPAMYKEEQVIFFLNNNLLKRRSKWRGEDEKDWTRIESLIIEQFDFFLKKEN